MSTLELAQFSCSEAYRRNPSILDGAFAHVFAEDTAEMISNCHYGFQTEDSGVGYTFRVLRKDKRQLSSGDEQEMNKAFAEVAQGQPIIIDALISGEYEGALTAPATEIALITPKAGHTSDDVALLMGRLLKQLSVTPNAYSPGWGPANGKDGVILLLIGWDSAEAHWQAVAPGSGPLADLVGTLRQIADIDLKHATLTRYERENA